MKHFADLPDLLSPSDLVKFLPIGKNAVYELLKTGAIPSLRITERRIVVTKVALGRYLGLGSEPAATLPP